jgi:prepilin-type N-terminal cleavage/methylation domain-containing protein
MNDFHQQVSRTRGFSLIEILISILIFAIAMLALAQLQGSLARISADSDMRRLAIDVAEELLETQRGFGLLDTDPDGNIAAYADIADATGTMTRGKTVFTITQDVVDYYYNPATGGFTTTNVQSSVHSDFKRITIDIGWDSAEFQMGNGQSTEGRLGSGNVRLQGIISSATTQGDSQVLTQSDGHEEPLVDYQPGANPDILSLSLGDNKFKESTVPEPDVIREGELVESRFDVITYSQSGSGALFLRREQFAAVSCNCTLRLPPGSAEDGGKRPTIWAGDEYVEGHSVDKSYGESSNSQQSPLCVACCRDHHDGGSSDEDHPDTAVNVYDPFRPATEYIGSGSLRGDHKHYDRTRNGDLVLAVDDGDSYVEACRMVRKDGFFKVTQDFRQEDRFLFPDDFLDEPSEIDLYSDYVTTAANAFENASYPDYENAPPCIGGPYPCVAEANFGGAFPAARGDDEMPSWTRLPLNGSATQQLRSRGVYIDYLTSDMRNVIDCLRAGGDTDSCQVGDVVLDRTGTTNLLEIIPFFDVQLTHLYRWNEAPTNTPVDTTNEGLEDQNAHSRGVASRDAYGCSTVQSRGHRGNLGFTDTGPVDPYYYDNLEMVTISVQSLNNLNGGGCNPPGEPGLRSIRGIITETVNGLKVTDIEVRGINGVLCDRTPDGFECYVTGDAVNPRMDVYGYDKTGQDYWTCLTGNYLELDSQVINGVGAHAVFSLEGDPAPSGSGYNLNVQSTACN